MTRLLLRAIDFGASAVSVALCARALCMHFYKDMERGLQRRRRSLRCYMAKHSGRADTVPRRERLRLDLSGGWCPSSAWKRGLQAEQQRHCRAGISCQRMCCLIGSACTNRMLRLAPPQWNPSIGLSFVLILVFGRQFVALLFIAPLLADIANRHDSLVWPTEILSVVAIGTSYSAALFSLSKRSICFDPALLSLRDVLLLILAATVSAAFVASCHVAIMIGAGVTPVGEFTTAFLRCWVADVVGILAVAPSIMIVLMRRRFLPFSIETVLQCAFTIGALILIFGIAEERKFQLFYVLLMPIVWMAVRNGLERAAAGILLTQIGVILGVALFPDTRDELVAFNVSCSC
jgi:integral membrane sensor domain MASE1